MKSILAFVLIFLKFGSAVDPKDPYIIAPISIGLVVLTSHFIGMELTGTSLDLASPLLRLLLRIISPTFGSTLWVRSSAQLSRPFITNY